jgi:hypothetical protein
MNPGTVHNQHGYECESNAGAVEDVLQDHAGCLPPMWQGNLNISTPDSLEVSLVCCDGDRIDGGVIRE